MEAPQLVEMFPAYYIFNGLLSILLVLHVIWTYFILKMAYFSVYAKEVQLHSLLHNMALTKCSLISIVWVIPFLEISMTTDYCSTIQTLPQK